MSDSELIAVGRVAKPHGLKGEVCVDWYADSPELLDAVDAIFLAAEGTPPRPFAVSKWRMHQDRPLVTFKGVAGRDAAEALRRQTIYVRAEDLPEPDGDAFFLYQLIDCTVVLGDGTVVGTIRDVMTPTEETEVWVIDAPGGDEILFPAAEETVVEADLDARKIVIDPPPGLIELYTTREDQPA